MEGLQAAGPYKYIEEFSPPGAPWLHSPAIESPGEVNPDIVARLKKIEEAAWCIAGTLLSLCQPLLSEATKCIVARCSTQRPCDSSASGCRLSLGAQGHCSTA